jgi:hypothetical protein
LSNARFQLFIHNRHFEHLIWIPPEKWDYRRLASLKRITIEKLTLSESLIYSDSLVGRGVIVSGRQLDCSDARDWFSVCIQRPLRKMDSEAIMAHRKEPSKKVLDKHAKFLAA